MSHDRDSDVTDQLRELGFLGESASDESGGEPAVTKTVRKQKSKPNPTKAAKKEKTAKVLSSAGLADEQAPAPKQPKAVPAERTAHTEDAKLPLRDIVLVQLGGVSHCGVIGDLAITGRLQQDGSRLIRLRFDFTHASKANWEIRILPVGIEREPGWVSCFHDGTSAMAVHVYDRRKAVPQAA